MTGVVVGSLVAGTVSVASSGVAVSAEEPPEWVEDLADRGQDEPDLQSWAEAEPAELPASVPAEPLPEPEFPEPETWGVTLGGAGDVGTAEEGSSGPVELAAGVEGFEGAELQVEVFDQDVAAHVGASGFVFGVSEVDDGEGPLSRAAADDGLPAELSIDYSAFAEAYGAGYADRLRVVALPDCVLAEPLPEDCAAGGVEVPSRNDRAAGALAVEVDDLAGLAADDTQAAGPPEEDVAGRTPGNPAASAQLDEERAGPPVAEVAAAGSSGVLFAVTADVSSETGTFAATPLSVTGQWQVSPGSGEFSYSYGFDIPAPAGGEAPAVGLSYSSGSVDGMTSTANAQASATGLGWSEFDGAFIERRYQPCVTTLISTDLCWGTQNAQLSLAGVSGELLPIDAEGNEWRVHSDAGWRVERLTGADNDDPAVNPGGGWQGEYWKVTATDGTQYFFGLGRNPTTGLNTNSVNAVPVFHDHPGERCWGNFPGQPNSFGLCHEPWRWNLDRVVDPDGNITTYVYGRGTNRYAGLNGLVGFNGLRYHRSSILDRIEYGGRANANAPTMRVLFGRDYRCTALDTSCTTIPTRTNGSQFPDVPNDLICSTTSCSANAPSFFQTSRYSSLRTEVWMNGWQSVKQYNLYHSLSSGGSGQQKLYLQRIVEVGVADPADPWGLPMPKTEFDYDWLPNRVDTDAERPPMQHGRIKAVINPFGGRTDVTYGQNRRCARTYRLALWENNDRDCFPQTMVDNGIRRVGVFHKYLVTKVTESAGSLTNPMTTSYSYLDDPAWAFNYGSFAQYDHEWGWSSWRGYGTARITQGSSTTQVRVFRGLEGDPLMVGCGGGNLCPLGHREAEVETFDGSRSFTDFPAWMGRTLEEWSLGDGRRLQSTLYEYERRVTHVVPGHVRDAEWADVSAVTETVYGPSGESRQRGGTTVYEEGPGLPVPRLAASLEAGWLDVTGDERCSRTTYADNPDTWMFEYPAANVVVAGDCDSTEELSVSETYYDGSGTLGAAPTRGNPTRQRTKLDGTTWAETSTVFDDLGRPVSVTDPNGATTTTSHVASPYHALPSQTTVTNALGHTNMTLWNRRHQAPQHVTDANGNLTSYTYDGLGRLTEVRLPTEQGTVPSWQFQYLISPDYSTLPTVRSRQLTSNATTGSGVTYDDAWVIYDKLGREWQTHQQSPEPGKVLVTSTAYDERGLVQQQNVLDAVAGTPGSLVVVPAWDNATRTTYDDLARPVRQDWLRDGEVARTTETAYTIDTVTVTGPDGNQVRETVDGLGRTVEVAERDGAVWTASSYGYDLAGNLESITDPAGNQTTYTYNLAGWRIGQDDPDRGTGSIGYDLAGNQTSVTDALGNAVHTVTDPLGRAVERRAGAPNGALLASWAYDGPGELGLLDSETRHTPEGAWVSDVTGYDARNRALGSTTTVPDGIPGLSGQYTTSQTYDRADRVTSATYPAVGGLTQETVTTSYSDRGLPTGFSGLEPYVRSTTYDDRGRLTASAFGPENPGGGVWMGRSWTYDVDQRLAATETYVAGSGLPDGIVSRHELGYDPAGNVSEQVTSLNGSDWRECFEHDARQRLVSAFTVGTDATCGDGERGTGDQPYEHRFIYAADGNLMARTEVVDPHVEDYILHGYPASGSDRPHAPTTIGGDSYTWDANGNLVERTGEDASETYSWDIEQQLASVTGADGTTSFVYDANGQRLLRRTGDGATLYVAGHEITASSDGSTVTAVRSYSFEGQLVATRSPDGLSYVLTDGAGSVEMAVESGGQPTATRSYEPYGQVRTEEGDMDTDRGFVGQIEDASTGLSYLQNRYYDTNAPTFLSPDPIYDTSNIKSLNPYSYAAGNPSTFSDPAGLSPTLIHGLQMENSALRTQNSQLRGHIKQLGSHIEGLQNIIKKQNRTINKLITRVKALEGIIRQQQSIIRSLVNKVNYLVGVVNYQRAVIGRLQAKIAYQQRIINAQASRIRYYQGVVNQMGFRLWGGTAAHGVIMANIHYGRGIPKGAFGIDNVAFYKGQASSLQGEVDQLALESFSLGSSFKDAANGRKLQRANERYADLGAAHTDLWKAYAGLSLDYMFLSVEQSGDDTPHPGAGDWVTWGASGLFEMIGMADWGHEGWDMWATTHEDKPWMYCTYGTPWPFFDDRCPAGVL